MTAFSQLKKILFIFALAGYAGITLFGALHIAHMARSGMPMEGCPFAIGEHSLCEMDTSGHMKAWQEFSTTILPTIKILVLASIAFAAVFFGYWSPPIVRLLLHRRREWGKTLSLYQQLFSQGILHPKDP